MTFMNRKTIATTIALFATLVGASHSYAASKDMADIKREITNSMTNRSSDCRSGSRFLPSPRRTSAIQPVRSTWPSWRAMRGSSR